MRVVVNPEGRGGRRSRLTQFGGADLPVCLTADKSGEIACLLCPSSQPKRCLWLRIRALRELTRCLLEGAKGYPVPFCHNTQMRIAAQWSQMADLAQTPYVKVRSEPVLMIAITGMATSLRPPAGLSRGFPVPAPAVVKGPVSGPLRVLDHWGRRRRPAITTGGLTPQTIPPVCFDIPISSGTDPKQSRDLASHIETELFATLLHRTADDHGGSR